jgi:hypothetical protein
MTTFCLRVLHSPLQFTTAFVVVDLILIAIGWRSGLDANTWPGWLQGIGSVEAILVAVWVTWHQAETQRRIEAEAVTSELLGILRSIRTEVRLLRLHVDRDIGAMLEQSAHDTPFRHIFPVDEDQFPIYRAFLPKLGMIDDRVRNQIVESYGSAQSFVSTFRYHNMLLERTIIAEEMAISSNTVEAITKAKQHLQGLQAYSNSLRASFEAAMTSAARLLAMLPADPAG